MKSPLLIKLFTQAAFNAISIEPLKTLEPPPIAALPAPVAPGVAFLAQAAPIPVSIVALKSSS
ncbi:hypothetical protein D3C85_1737750 [compost metagenome]